jgi:hypothetical protein
MRSKCSHCLLATVSLALGVVPAVRAETVEKAAVSPLERSATCHSRTPKRSADDVATKHVPPSAALPSSGADSPSPLLRARVFVAPVSMSLAVPPVPAWFDATPRAARDAEAWLPATRAASDHADDKLGGFRLRFGDGYHVPTLLHYAPAQSRPNLALSVSPGGPCTAACLKLAASF